MAEVEDVKPLIWSDVERDDDKMFPCPVPTCRRRYARLYNLKTHFQTHSPNNPKPFKCSGKGCVAAFTHKDRLLSHVKKVHQGIPKMFGCNFEGCFATFDTDVSVLRHFRRAHPDGNFEETMNKLACQSCNDLFFSRYQLKAHIVRVHGYVCEQCGKECKSQTEMRRHSGNHTAAMKRGLRPIECNKCKITLNGLDELREHKKTEEHRVNVKKFYSCSICGAQYTNRNSINVHLKSHDEERTLYHCPVEGCSRAYYHMKNLQQHHRTHSEESPRHYCEICDRHFSTKQKLYKHKTIMHDPLREIKLKEKEEAKKQRKLQESGEVPMSKVRKFNRNLLIEKLARGPDTDLTVVKSGPKKIQEPVHVTKPFAELYPELLEKVKTKLREKPTKRKRPAYSQRNKFTHAHVNQVRGSHKFAGIKAAPADVMESVPNAEVPSEKLTHQKVTDELLPEKPDPKPSEMI